MPGKIFYPSELSLEIEVIIYLYSVIEPDDIITNRILASCEQRKLLHASFYKKQELFHNFK